MKLFYFLTIWVGLGMLTSVYGQSSLFSGPAPGTMTLVPFAAPVCFGNGSTSAVACGNTVTFNFTSFQISSCPTSGQMPTPGSVTYGGPGSSGSFTFYHTLSYSSSNEHQQLVFSQPIQFFQFSCSGPFGSGENFSVQAYNGAALLGNHTFFVPGQGANLTYYITAPSITRIQFTETTAISPDDELFGDFMISGLGCPLPVEMLQADARVIDNKAVRVDWETRGELGLDYYEVQRSTDGTDWEPVGRLAARNDDGPNSYSLRDESPLSGLSYYRVETMGLDGDHTYTGTMRVQTLGTPGFRFAMWPNPAGSTVRVDFQGLEGKKQVEVLTLLGHKVMEMDTEAGQTDLDISALGSAIYLVRITHEGRSVTRRLAVQ